MLFLWNLCTCTEFVKLDTLIDVCKLFTVYWHSCQVMLNVFLLTIHNCWVLYIHYRSELFPWNTFLYMYENVCSFFLLYISIKNKTSVFCALPFSHAPRRGVSWKGGPAWFHSRSDTSEATFVWFPAPSGGRTVVPLSLSVFTVFSGFKDQGDGGCTCIYRLPITILWTSQNTEILLTYIWSKVSLGNINCTGVHFPTKRIRKLIVDIN